MILSKQIAPLKIETLSNGFKIYTKSRNNAPVVSVQLWVKTGSIH